ncbi:MAG: UTP--glucose-1-phosphate uridylyltransferase [Endomicrobium sp.]|jgi:glucose-6-phosphate isomerase/phosphomannomutase/UDP-N-acetylglucosamine pyrophosphorylase|nr:UTP--glucose-1-phosphate uridylyltransferase [Endomicrobium sp.]
MSKIIKMLNFKKIVSAVTAVCFTFSIFSANAFAAPAQSAAPALQTVNASPALNPSNFVVPFNIGRVTDSVNFKSDKVIVQIQDLHAHEETQRNIAGILSLLDSKYGISKVYVEGAVGGVDTSWLAGISNESLKSSITDSLLAEGVLTGSELFSVNSGKTNILKGIEDRKAYLDNFQRLITIDSQRDEIKSLFPEIRMILSYLADRHYGKENRRIGSIVNRYRNGKISFDKYFSFLVKKAKQQNVYFGFYPSIVLLADIMKVQNRLNKNKINSQIAGFLEELKSELAYSEYKELIEYSSKPETEGVFYFKLAEFYNKGNYGGKYPELAKFLQFIDLNQTINPINLVNEERALLWEVKNKAAVNGKEKELIYLSSFIDLLEGFLENKITAPEYQYFERELPKFKTLWTKYTRMTELPALERYYSLFESFYKVNVERNNIFVKEISGNLPGTKASNMTFSGDMVMTDAAGLLESAKEVEVVVTGGFHTQDVSRILQNARQSYIVITPNVTRDADLADKLFAEDVIRISKYIPTNTFQKALQSARLDLTDGSVKSAVGIFFQKAVIDAFKAEAEKQLQDNGIDPSKVSAAELSEGITEGIENSSIKSELSKKGVEDFTIKGVAVNSDGSYLVTVESKGIETVYLVAESGISDASADTGSAEEKPNVIIAIAGDIAEGLSNAVNNIGEFFGLADNRAGSTINFLIAYDNYKALPAGSQNNQAYAENLKSAIDEVEKLGDRVSDSLRQQVEEAKVQTGWTPAAPLLTADSTKKAFSRFFGERFTNTIVGRFIVSVIIAPFYERSKLMEIYELRGMADNPGLNEEESADIRRQADEALRDFLMDHEDYKMGEYDERAAYRAASSNIFRISGRAYIAVLRVTKIEALANLAANIANVAAHMASNFAGITKGGIVLTRDAEAVAVPNEQQISALLSSMNLSAENERTFREIIGILIELNDTNALDAIFNKANNENRIELLSALAELNNRRSLAEYVETFKTIAASSKEGVNPTTGKTTNPVKEKSAKQIGGFEDRQYQRYSDEGLKHADELAVVLVAGGVGDRLRYKVRNEKGELVDGIKIGIQPSIIDQQSYLENVLSEMDGYALQQGNNAHPILTIMTSDSTHDMTVKFITEKLGYTLKEVEVAPGIVRVELTNNARPTDKIYIMTQKNVPGILGPDGRLAIAEDKDEAGNPTGHYSLETKPHGHGDVHELMYRTGVAGELQKAGKSKLMFIQDTNGAVMNTALSMTGMMFEEGKKLAVGTVAIDPGVDAVGSLIEVTDPETGRTYVFNLEYNYVKEMIKNGTIKQEDVPNYINGNVNIFAVDVGAYIGILERTEGKVGEFTNPKPSSDPNTYKSTARIETEMQRIYTEFAEDEVGIINFHDRPFAFTTAKNGIRNADGSFVEGEQKETLPSSEEDINENYRKILRFAGVEVSEAGEEITLGQQYKRGSQIKLRNWGYTPDSVKARFSGKNTISARSAVRLDGNVGFNGLSVDGAVNVVAAKGVSVRLNGAIQNDGYRTVMYADDGEKARELLEQKQYDLMSQYGVRGYYAEKLQELDIKITRPGNYEVSVAGNRVIVRDTASGRVAIFDSLNVEVDSKTEFTEMESIGEAEQPQAGAVRAKTEPLTKTNIWQSLKRAYDIMKRTTIAELYKNDPDRQTRELRERNYTMSLNGESTNMRFDFGFNNLTQDEISLLLDLARDRDVKGFIRDMMSGVKINTSENRAVLHTALRNVKMENGKIVSLGPVYVDGQDVMPQIIRELEKARNFVNRLHGGELKGATGKPIKTIVSIGIGGSDLGPRMASEALEKYRKEGIEVKYISNVEPRAVQKIIESIDDLETTLIIVESKTFTTQETTTNAQAVKEQLIEKLKASAALEAVVTKMSGDQMYVMEFELVQAGEEGHRIPMEDIESIQERAEKRLAERNINVAQLKAEKYEERVKFYLEERKRKYAEEKASVGETVSQADLDSIRVPLYVDEKAAELDTMRWYLDYISKEYQEELSDYIVSRHFVAVSTAKQLVDEFGIDSDNNMFEFWDFVGGRYSIWSTIGLPLMCSIGFDNFMDMLKGANTMDRHTLEADYEDNIPMRLALIWMWYSNFYGYDLHAVISYSEDLAKFAKYLQQLYMESLGKFVDKDGNPVDYKTGVAVFGEPGTDSQHSFFQLFHQGTVITPIDFIGFVIAPAIKENMPMEERRKIQGRHDIFMSNLYAQREAMAFGKDYEQVKAETEALRDEVVNKMKAENALYADIEFEIARWNAIVPQKAFEGNRPSNLILFDRLTPEALGMNIALYEHLTAIQSAIWNINAFDQWGVELGKSLAKILQPFMGLGKEAAKLAGKVSGTTLDNVGYYNNVLENAPEFAQAAAEPFNRGGIVARTAEAWLGRMQAMFTKKETEKAEAEKDSEKKQILEAKIGEGAALTERLFAQFEILTRTALAEEMSAEQIVDLFANRDIEIEVDGVKKTVKGLTKEEAEKMKATSLNPESEDRIKFGTAGYRKQFGPMFNYVHAMVIAQADAMRLKAKKRIPRVLIGYDTRFMSKEIAEIYAGVLSANGINVYLSDKDIPTPVISYLLKLGGYDSAVNITASHNAFDNNGIKINEANGGQAVQETTSALERNITDIVSNGVKIRYIPAEQGKRIARRGVGRINVLTDKEAMDVYLSGLEAMLEGLGIDKTDGNLKGNAAGSFLAVDTKSGTSPAYFKRMLEMFGITEANGNLSMINDEFDPTFQGEDPNPDRNIDKLVETVTEAFNRGRLSVGIATDPDADRLGFTVNGIRYTTDQLIFAVTSETLMNAIREYDATGRKQVFAEVINQPTSASTESLRDNLENAAGIIADEKGLTGQAKADFINEVKNNVTFEVVRTPVGFKWIAPELEALEKRAAKGETDYWIIGAEESGALVLGKNKVLTYDKDGIFIMLYLALLTIKTGKSMAEMLETADKITGWTPEKYLQNIGLGELSQLAVVKEYLRNASIPGAAQSSFIDSLAEIMEKYGAKITGVKDVNIINGVKVDEDSTKAKDDKDQPFEGVEITTDKGIRVIVRLSGTEPIVKAYVDTDYAEVGSEVKNGKTVPVTKAQDIAKSFEKVVKDVASPETAQQETESGIQKIISDIIKAIAGLLGINLRSTYISKNASELIGKEDTIILGEYSDDQSLFDNAAEKAALGKNVNIIMPYGAAAETIESVGNTGSRHIYKKTITQDNGYSVNVWYYSGEVTDSAAAYDAFNYVANEIGGNIGIVENASNISLNDITVAAPLAAVFKVTSNAAEDIQAKNEGYQNFTNGMSEEDKVKVLAGRQKEDREGDNMRNQLPLITNVGAAQIKNTDMIASLMTTVFSVEIASVSEFEQNAGDLINFIRAAHAADKRVVLNFKPANAQEAGKIMEMINGKGLRGLRISLTENGVRSGIDGVMFDFDSLGSEEFNKIAGSLATAASAVKRENSGAIISVKSDFYAQRIAGIDNYNEYINISGNYNENTVDVNEIAQSAKDAIERGAKALVIDYEVLELLQTRGINVDIYGLFLGIVAAWTSYVKKTPEGIYRNARRSGYKENINLTPEQESGLYEALRELNAGNKAAVQTVSEILQTSKANVLDKEETAEARGYVQGVLEQFLVKNFGEKTFEYKTNADVYRIALVMAKMNGMSDDAVKSALDSDSEKIAQMLVRLDIDDVSAGQVQKDVQEGINVLISDLEDNRIDNDGKPQAITDLLAMLGIAQTTEVKMEQVKFDDQRAGIVAILSAA